MPACSGRSYREPFSTQMPTVTEPRSGSSLGEDADAVRQARGPHRPTALASWSRSLSASLRESRILPELDRPRGTFTSITSPSRTTSVTWRTRSFASCEMCTRPSVPGMISTNAPKSTTRRTVPR